jgi:hypothetical protein
MGLSHSPKVVTDGLILYYDQGNTPKSWKGAPTTNLTSNLGIVAIQAAPTVTYVGIEDGWKKYSLNGTWSAGTYPYSIGIDGVAFTGGVTYSSGVFIKTNVPAKFATLFTGMNYVNEPMNNGGTSFSILQPDGSKFVGRTGFQYTSTTTQTGYILSQPVVGQSFSSATDFVYIKDGQVETGSFTTPFTSGTRSNTQALLDLTNRNTITANSLSYASNNSFSFNGTNNSITVGQTLNYIPALSNFTLETWLRVPAYPTAAANNAYGQTDRAGVLFGAAYYSGAALYWNGNSAGTALNIFAFIRGQDAYRQTSSKSISLNTWTHLVMVNNYTASLIQFYVDGVLFHETTGPSQQYDSSLVPTAGNIGLCKAQIDGGGTSNYSNLNCEVPIARIYKDKALSAAEVRQNFNALRGRFGI